MNPEGLHLLVVCTANQCRSPMGEALARRDLQRSGIAGVVLSAGTHAIGGIPATESAELTMQRMGLDIADHLSQPLSDELVEGASLIWCMERLHVVEICRQWPEAFERTFTLKDLARRVAAAHRHPSEPLPHWLARVGAGREAADLLGHGADDDVADPIGRSLRHYRRAAEVIAESTGAVVAALNGPLPVHDGALP